MYQFHVSVYDRSTNIIATYGEIWKFKPERILLLYSFDMEHYDAIGTSYGYASIFENRPELNEIEDRMISQLKENGPSEQILQYRRELIEKEPLQVVNQSTIQINSIAAKIDLQEIQKGQKEMYHYQPLTSAYLKSNDIDMRLS